jgi:hypothetical protein
LSTVLLHITKSFHTERLCIPVHSILAVMRNALALRDCNVFHTPQGSLSTPAAGVLVAEAKPLRTQRERGREMSEVERGVLTEGGCSYPGNCPS